MPPCERSEVPPMSDFPPSIVPGDLHTENISTYSGCGLAGAFGFTPAATAWPASNRAIFVPFRVPRLVTVYKMACGTGTGTTGNFDLGIYDRFGNKLVSTGSTAKTTASAERIVDVTDTVLLPGLYYLAMATDGTEGYIASVPGNLGMVKLMGCREMETAFALPDTATFATVQAAFVPSISARLRAT
jgi:hypothetical protein